VYYEKLGSVYDKVERVERLAISSQSKLYPRHPAKAGVQGNRSDPAALDSRFRGMRCRVGPIGAARGHPGEGDLSTAMVGEFPELQESWSVLRACMTAKTRASRQAIAEHYKPLGPTDSCPTVPVSVVVALATSLLPAAFLRSASAHRVARPFALRRAALGIIRLVLENGLSLRWDIAFATAVSISRRVLGDSPEQGS